MIDYLGVIWNRKWLIVLGTFACIMAVGIISWLLPPSYQSELILNIGQVGTVDENGELQRIVIEDGNNLKTRLTSEPFLFSIIERNQLELEPKDLKAKAEVVSREAKEREENMIKFSIRARSPEEVINLINLTAEYIIDQHKKKFDEAMRINLLSQEELEKQIESTEGEIRGMKDTLTQIQAHPRVDAPAVILLQANLAEKVESLTKLKGTYRKVQLANSPIGSENTKVYDPPIMPKHPISPKILLNIIISAVLGVMMTMILAFFLESTQKIREKVEQ
ncbi:MAG: hypothetical protein JSU92_01590 [Deltaproteobacteria bacterium]|nr:MAG: hypothetical protein JSU92_01590 [Deltaproteobacteria bacterium]